VVRNALIELAVKARATFGEQHSVNARTNESFADGARYFFRRKFNERERTIFLENFRSRNAVW